MKLTITKLRPLAEREFPRFKFKCDFHQKAWFCSSSRGNNGVVKEHDLGLACEGYKTIKHTFSPGLFKINLKLIALNFGNHAVTELAVKHAQADGDVTAALVAEADRTATRLNDAGGFAGEAATAGCACPAWATPCTALDMCEGVATFTRICAPHAFAAAHAAFMKDMFGRQFANKA